MKNTFYLIRKYWLKHKKSAAALLFSGVLLVIVICVTLLQLRAIYNRQLHDTYDNIGQYDVALPDAREEFIEKLSDENTIRGEMYILGKVHNGEKSYTYGFLDDPEGIAHIPFEDGRLPEKDGEIAIDREVLKRLGYLGKVGDSITLDIGEFTLVGIIDEKYGNCRLNSEIKDHLVHNNSVYPVENAPELYPIPLLFVSPTDKENAEFKLTMLHKLNAELRKNVILEGQYSGFLIQRIIDEEYEEVRKAANDEYKGDGSVHISCLQYNDRDSEGDYYANFKANDIRLLFMWAGLAAIIAVLSILSVLRNIFAERKDSMAMLHKIGLSKRKIRLLYAVECVIFVILQTIVGIAFGILCHLGIYTYQVNVLDMTPYSGLTLDPYVTKYTTNPYLAACVFSAIILPVGYIFAGLLSNIKPHSRRRKKAASLRSCFSRTFRTGTVTIIQTAALTLICFGTMIGYMFFTDSGKEIIWDANIGPIPKVVQNFGRNAEFNFEEDGLEEYYHSEPPQISGIGSFKLAAVSASVSGIDDNTANKLENAVSTGELENTFVISKTPMDNLKYSITFGTNEEKEFMISITADECKSLFEEENYLYTMKTALADENSIGSLSGCVISGKIDLDKIRTGEQVILVLTYGDAPLNVGDKITLASAVTDNGFGISGLSASDTSIGAVVKFSADTEKVLKYAAATVDNYSVLTTATGAKALGLNNPNYTEIFAKKPLKGSLIPMDSGMELLSYSVEKRRIFLEKAAQYGSTILIVLLMSLLGFAAYFNGIGMKIRLKEYEISTLRAIGTPMKKLRQKLMLYSLKLPVIACTLSYGGVKIVQRITYLAFKKEQAIYRAAYVDIPDDLWEQVLNHDMAAVSDLSEIQENCQIQIDELVNKYFLNDELWMVHTLIPMLVIFAVMCIITVLLTRLAFRRFSSDISQSMSKGRKRQ